MIFESVKSLEDEAKKQGDILDRYIVAFFHNTWKNVAVCEPVKLEMRKDIHKFYAKNPLVINNIFASTKCLFGL